MKHFTAVNMTSYMKLLPDWHQKNRKPELFDIMKEIKTIFINLPTKKTLLSR